MHLHSGDQKESKKIYLICNVMFFIPSLCGGLSYVDTIKTEVSESKQTTE